MMILVIPRAETDTWRTRHARAISRAFTGAGSVAFTFDPDSCLVYRDTKGKLFNVYISNDLTEDVLIRAKLADVDDTPAGIVLCEKIPEGYMRYDDTES